MGSLGTPKSIRKANPAQIQDSVFKMFDMHGKVTVITGGSGGIGYEVGRALAEAGSDIALWYHKSPQALKLAATIERDFGVKCKAYQCAVENFEEVKNEEILHM
jgi:sorbose reductase